MSYILKKRWSANSRRARKRRKIAPQPDALCQADCAPKDPEKVLVLLPGVYQLIFAFLPTDADCRRFGLVCNYIHDVYMGMIERSSLRWHLVRVLSGKPHTLHPRLFPTNPFPRLDPNRFVQSIEEYHNNIPECLHKLMAVLTAENRTGVKAVVSGGMALEWLYNRGDFSWGHTELEFDATNPKYERPHTMFYENPRDCDIFVFGHNSTEVARRIARAIVGVYGDNVEKCTVRGCIVDIVLSHTMPSSRTFVIGGRIYCERSEQPYVVQIIVYDHRFIHPVDVLATFDLSCCRFGYVPGQDKLCCTADALHSVNARQITIPHGVCARIRGRMCKYAYRMVARFDEVPQRDLVTYHTAPRPDTGVIQLRKFHHTVKHYTWVPDEDVCLDSDGDICFDSDSDTDSDVILDYDNHTDDDSDGDDDYRIIKQIDSNEDFYDEEPDPGVEGVLRTFDIDKAVFTAHRLEKVDGNWVYTKSSE